MGKVRGRADFLREDLAHEIPDLAHEILDLAHEIPDLAHENLGFKGLRV